MSEAVVLKIKGSDEPGHTKKVSSAMAWLLRENGYFVGRAIKQKAINQAIKSVAALNQQIAKANVVLSLDLSFKQTEDGLPAVEFVASEAPEERPTEFKEYKISSKDIGDKAIAKLATAMALPCKENKGVRLSCIGPASVYKAVVSSIVAKGYIYANGLESVFIPNWKTIGEDKKVSLISIEFFGKKKNIKSS
jgi:stage V sporulation protein SpoVS